MVPKPPIVSLIVLLSLLIATGLFKSSNSTVIPNNSLSEPQDNNTSYLPSSDDLDIQPTNPNKSHKPQSVNNISADENGNYPLFLDIPIIISHNSISSHFPIDGLVSPWVRCQNATLWSQLSCGTSMLSITVLIDGGVAWVSHGQVKLEMTLESLIGNITLFTKSNPDRLILAHLRDCVGTGCLGIVKDIAFNYGIRWVSESDGCFKGEWRLDDMFHFFRFPKGGAFGFIETDCVDENWDDRVECYGEVEGYTINNNATVGNNKNANINTDTPTNPISSALGDILFKDSYDRMIRRLINDRTGDGDGEGGKKQNKPDHGILDHGISDSLLYEQESILTKRIDQFYDEDYYEASNHWSQLISDQVLSFTTPNHGKDPSGKFQKDGNGQRSGKIKKSNRPQFDSDTSQIKTSNYKALELPPTVLNPLHELVMRFVYTSTSRFEYLFKEMRSRIEHKRETSFCFTNPTTIICSEEYLGYITSLLDKIHNDFYSTIDTTMGHIGEVATKRLKSKNVDVMNYFEEDKNQPNQKHQPRITIDALFEDLVNSLSAAAADQITLDIKNMKNNAQPKPINHFGRNNSLIGRIFQSRAEKFYLDGTENLSTTDPRGKPPHSPNICNTTLPTQYNQVVKSSVTTSMARNASIAQLNQFGLILHQIQERAENGIQRMIKLTRASDEIVKVIESSGITNNTVFGDELRDDVVVIGGHNSTYKANAVSEALDTANTSTDSHTKQYFSNIPLIESHYNQQLVQYIKVLESRRTKKTPKGPLQKGNNNHVAFTTSSIENHSYSGVRDSTITIDTVLVDGITPAIINPFVNSNDGNSYYCCYGDHKEIPWKTLDLYIENSLWSCPTQGDLRQSFSRTNPLPPSRLQSPPKPPFAPQPSSHRVPTMVQAHWQYSPKSVTIGILYGSSIINDQRKSNLNNEIIDNRIIKRNLYSSALELLELDDVCAESSKTGDKDRLYDVQRVNQWWEMHAPFASAKDRP